MSLVPSVPEVVLGSLTAAVSALWRLGRRDCEERIKALGTRVDELEGKVHELYERLLAEARHSAVPPRPKE